MSVTAKLDGKDGGGSASGRKDQTIVGTEYRIQVTEGNYVVNYDFVGLESTTRIYRATDRSPVAGAKLT
jgi:hypothetical protein